MTRVIQRCSTCGLEHDEPVGECEACLGTLRYWCRAHSGEIGWLDASACRRCAEEKARPMPRPAPPRVRTRPAHVPHPPRSAARPVFTLPGGKPATARAPASPSPRTFRPVRTARDERASGYAKRTILWTGLLCAIGFATSAVYEEAVGGGHVAAAVIRGALGGGLLGCILGIPLAAVRLRLLAWLGGSAYKAAHRDMAS